MDDFNNNGQQGYDPNLYGQPASFGSEQNAYGGQPQYDQYNPNLNQTGESKGLSIAAMVVGILSTTCCCGLIGVFMGIAAIIMGAVGQAKGGKGMAIAGIITGGCGVLFGIIWTILSFSGAITYDFNY